MITLIATYTTLINTIELEIAQVDMFQKGVLKLCYVLLTHLVIIIEGGLLLCVLVIEWTQRNAHPTHCVT